MKSQEHNSRLPINAELAFGLIFTLALTTSCAPVQAIATLRACIDTNGDEQCGDNDIPVEGYEIRMPVVMNDIGETIIAQTWKTDANGQAELGINQYELTKLYAIANQTLTIEGIQVLCVVENVFVKPSELSAVAIIEPDKCTKVTPNQKRQAYNGKIPTFKQKSHLLSRNRGIN